jgi:hypothetical protein
MPYKTLGKISTSPYTNGGDHFVVIIGSDMGGSPPTTLAPGVGALFIAVQDQTGTNFDTHGLGDTQEAVTPTATGTQYIFTMPRRMLVSPNGKVVFNPPCNGITLIECDTLQEALAIL